MISAFLLAVLALPPARAGSLSYAQALERALAANPSLVQSEATLLGAEGSLITARGTFDPSFGLGADAQNNVSESFSQFGQVASHTRRSGFSTSLNQFLPTGTSLGLGWSVDSATYLYELLDTGMTWEQQEPQRYSTLSFSIAQSLLQGHRLAYNLSAVREAERTVSQAEASLQVARLAAVADTAEAYWNLVYLQDLEVIAREAVAVAQEEQRVVQAMVAAGQLAPVEGTRVEAAVVQAKTSLLEAEARRRAGSEALALLLGVDPQEPIAPESQPQEPVALALDDARVVEAAMAGNPSLLVYRSEVDSAEVALSNARHARLPELQLTGGAGLNGYEPGFADAVGEMFDGKLRYWQVGADLSVPLGNRADRGRVQQAQANLAIARQQLEAMERTVAANVLIQVRAVETGRQRVELADANLRLAEATLSAEKARQREGRAIQKDVLEAQRAVSNAQGARVQARVEYALAVVELGRLQGRIEGVAR
ncbi:MAG: TolC family protein [Pseudomonadota bacterium]